MKYLVVEIFTAYILTALIVKSNVFYKYRQLIKKKTPRLTRAGLHPIDCRMCVGLYISVFVGLAYSDFYSILLIYGTSYFLATQER